jgi:TRAP transporter TAXI family solute receptor
MKKRLLICIYEIVLLSITLFGCITLKQLNSVKIREQEGPSKISNASRPKNEVIIATGGTLGVFYPLGCAFAENWNNQIKGIYAYAVASGANISNINMLKDGVADVIFVQNDSAYYAYNGLEMFKNNAFPGIRGIAVLYTDTCQLIISRKSDIKTVFDLKGKTVAVGTFGFGAETNARHILAAAGLNYDDMNIIYTSDYGTGLSNGTIEAAFATAGVPTIIIQDLLDSNAISIIPIDNTIAINLKNNWPFYKMDTIAAGSYQGVSSEIKTVSVKTMLAVSEKMDPSLVYHLLETLFSNSDKYLNVHKKCKEISLKNALDGMSIPLHTGAEKFYKDKL